MDFIQGFDRDQLQMMSFEEFVSSDSWARVVDLFVEILPLNNLGFCNTPAEEGRPPFHPSDMLKLYLYGYKNHLRSSRKLAHACKVNMEVIWDHAQKLGSKSINITFFVLKGSPNGIVRLHN